MGPRSSDRAQRRDQGERLLLIDFDRPENNDWLAVNQFTVVEGKIERRPDVVLFVNGLPLVVIELKNAADPKATIETAYKQLSPTRPDSAALPHQRPADDLGRDQNPDRLRRHAHASASPSGKRLTAISTPAGSLETAIKGVFEQSPFSRPGPELHRLRGRWREGRQEGRRVSPVPCGAEGGGHARCGRPARRGTAGAASSGTPRARASSSAMALFRGQARARPGAGEPHHRRADRPERPRRPALRHLLACKELLRQTPVQAESRATCASCSSVSPGGVVFTTIQKFFPDDGRRATRAVRPPQHDRDRRRGAPQPVRLRIKRRDGRFCTASPSICATPCRTRPSSASPARPIELADNDTRIVFGDYIDIYDIQPRRRRRRDRPIYYECAAGQARRCGAEKPMIDDEFEEITEGEEDASSESSDRKWAQLEAMVGAENGSAWSRRDLVEHFERRVGGDRRQGHDRRHEPPDLRRPLRRDSSSCARTGTATTTSRGDVKVVMTGSASDPTTWQPHIRSKAAERLADRFKDPDDPLKIVIVRDMWLTGFDAPCLHTMYVDKPMQGHGLMQAIARVNRVFRDKPGGLVVDYIGLADNSRRPCAPTCCRTANGTSRIEKEEASISTSLSPHGEQAGSRDAAMFPRLRLRRSS